MISFKRLLLGLGLIGVLSLLVLWLLHKRGIGVIPPNSDATISVDGHKVTIEKNNERITKYAPEGTKIVINKDGSVKVVSRQFGFCREFGMGLLVDGRHIALQADVKLAYLRRLGFHANLGVTTADARLLLIPALSVSYNLPWEVVSNTSVFIGHSVAGDAWVTGARVSF